ncbi:unnamed protein product [Durusdinium trenchii]
MHAACRSDFGSMSASQGKYCLSKPSTLGFPTQNMALRYHRTFIDVETPTDMWSVEGKRGSSCPPPERPSCQKYEEWRCHVQVSQLWQRAAHLGTSSTTKPSTSGSEGSYGHPHVCRRPCIKFARGSCEQGAECGFCHSSHPSRPLTFDKSARNFLATWSKAKILEAVLPPLRAKAKAVTRSPAPNHWWPMSL